jgi:hypothetical protein
MDFIFDPSYRFFRIFSVAWLLRANNLRLYPTHPLTSFRVYHLDLLFFHVADQILVSTRFQRRNCRIQEHLIHCLGRRWSGM